MRHLLGILGVLAAGALIAVSAAMNWRFGLSLGRTEMDGQIYGLASVAADCLKALVPFFFFAAFRNRMWSQAAAAAVVWVVVTSYSLTSALGHAALNRFDTAGQRTLAADNHKDLRADLERAKNQLSWIPQHRPASAVQGEIDAMKLQKAWAFTSGCTDVTGKQGRDFCTKLANLNSEAASGSEAKALEDRIATIQGKLEQSGHSGGAMMAEADPQAAVLSKLTGLNLDQVQMAMTIFVALLIEVGSGFGMYVAFSQWRLHDRPAPSAPQMVAATSTAAVAVAEDEQPVLKPVVQPAAIAKPRSGANDNRSAPAARLMAPETDVERYYKEKVETQDGSSLTATSLYEDYCAWCEEQQKEPLALPTFGREFGELGVQKAKVAGRVRYIGIALKSDRELEEDKNLPALSTAAA
jgi:hypothetical protein